MAGRKGAQGMVVRLAAAGRVAIGGVEDGEEMIGV